MKTSAKVGLVAAGYVLAFVVSAAIVAVYAAVMDSPARQASSGMSAFSDSLLFLALLGLLCIPPTAAALFMLRPYRGFWLALSVAALLVAATSVAACVVHITAGSAGAGSFQQSWSTAAILRILVAPLCAIAFFLSALFAPLRSARTVLAMACGAEVLALAAVAFTWLRPA